MTEEAREETPEDPGEADVIAPEQEAPASQPAAEGYIRTVAPKDWPAAHGGLSYRQWLAQQRATYEDRADRQEGNAPYIDLDEQDSDDWSY